MLFSTLIFNHLHVAPIMRDGVMSLASHRVMSQSPEHDTPDSAASERECVLWDAFRDEHFEGIISSL